MAVDERARRELDERAEASLGRDASDTMMALLPPVDWADVATKHDLAELEGRLAARIDGLGASILSAMRQEMLRLLLGLLALVVALVVPLVTLT